MILCETIVKGYDPARAPKLVVGISAEPPSVLTIASLCEVAAQQSYYLPHGAVVGRVRGEECRLRKDFSATPQR
jgi:hypothetical protein